MGVDPVASGSNGPAPRATAADAPTAAPLPAKARTMDEHLQAFDDVPLFMKSLPDDGKEHDTTAMEALQSLTFDGTPDEVATNFKKQGNEYFVGKRYKEARTFYTQGIDAYPDDTALREALLINRAACNLALENYGMVLKDCSTALGLNARSTKAFYRSAKALSALERYIEAIDCCDHMLELDSSNGEAKLLKKVIVDKKAAAEKREAESKERDRRRKELKIAMDRAFLARGLWVQTSSKPPDNPTPAHFDPDALLDVSRDSVPLLSDTIKWSAPDPIRTAMIFPVMFLYPQHQQSDFVSHFHEDAAIGDQIAQMFPVEARGTLPWDTAGEYVASNLNVYATTHGKRLLKIGKKLTLREVLDQGARDADASKGQGRDGVVLQDGILSLVVLPKGKAESEWIDRFKKERDEASGTI